MIMSPLTTAVTMVVMRSIRGAVLLLDRSTKFWARLPR